MLLFWLILVNWFNAWRPTWRAGLFSLLVKWRYKWCSLWLWSPSWAAPACCKGMLSVYLYREEICSPFACWHLSLLPLLAGQARKLFRQNERWCQLKRAFGQGIHLLLAPGSEGPLHPKLYTVVWCIPYLILIQRKSKLFWNLKIYTPNFPKKHRNRFNFLKKIKLIEKFEINRFSDAFSLPLITEKRNKTRLSTLILIEKR